MHPASAGSEQARVGPAFEALALGIGDKRDCGPGLSKTSFVPPQVHVAGATRVAPFVRCGSTEPESRI